jgi:primosomal protein N''
METFGGENDIDRKLLSMVEKCEVADVQVSSYSNQAKYKILFMMQKYEERMEECRQNMKSKFTDAKDIALLKK